MMKPVRMTTDAALFRLNAAARHAKKMRRVAFQGARSQTNAAERLLPLRRRCAFYRLPVGQITLAR